ncbi:Retrovirus-related Pol polyprotein from type-1 retrotransposable element R1 4 [Eumeta japonica]|uniref:Retrovirus-related Pol polyprotein from type-1 retrotransposable element R1 4 n=1 Tax=Eumeta variegata TaxID=151549 RepID=A0A4C1ZXS3_EUMVA|nr:Retrovirus-related Pol polyprotein from type-1 retrotransposable element R1 4 [Eumeta japonica]
MSIRQKASKFEQVSTKASAVRASLARLMANVGGPKQSKILLLSTVVTSWLTYGISIWSDALGIQETWRKAGPVYRLSALRVASAFRTIFEETIDVWLNRNHGEVNYYLTQMLSGHGFFRAYLHRFKRDDSPECLSCPGKPEDAEHVFFVCPRFNFQRDELETILNQRIQPETLVEAMLSTKAAWNATSTFTTEVLTDLRSIERRRARDSN